MWLSPLGSPHQPRRFDPDSNIHDYRTEPPHPSRGSAWRYQRRRRRYSRRAANHEWRRATASSRAGVCAGERLSAFWLRTLVSPMKPFPGFLLTFSAAPVSGQVFAEGRALFRFFFHCPSLAEVRSERLGRKKPAGSRARLLLSTKSRTSLLVCTYSPH